MNSKLYIGNLAPTTSEKDLQDLCSPHGPVNEVHLPLDRETGRPRGFGFVTMATPEGAQAAIQALNGHAVAERTLTVSEARPREERSGSFGGGRGGQSSNRRY